MNRELKRKIVAIVVVMAVAMQAWAWKPLFVGHRGSYRGVENTAEAFRNGVDEYGYDGLECDVRVTLDGEYVICHDDNTTRLGGALTVSKATLAELKAETLTQTRGGVSYTGKICTMDEYLDICVEKNVFPVIELKYATGLSTGSMENFPGLAQKVINHGLTDKVVFLTSMQKSLEYIKTNYPQFKAQYLCSSTWKTNTGWCRHYDINPSIQAGYFDMHTVNTFRRLGHQVAVWTVNSEANYLKYGNMGVYMMTCDYLRPNQMPELKDIDWSAIDSIPDPLVLQCDTVYSFTASQGNLPANFPHRATKSSSYNAAMQAIVVDGKFYTNDCKTHTLLSFGSEGVVETRPGTNGTGIALDDAHNMILRADSMTTTPSTLMIYPRDGSAPVKVDFTLLHNGQTYFISATGDLMSEQGGYVYFYPKGQKFVDRVKIAHGEYVETTSSGELAVAGMNTSVVVPLDGDTARFVYQSRTSGIFMYDGEDKGEYITGETGTYAPNRNTSVGSLQFELAGHTLFVHPSGANYNGGITIRDMSSDQIDVLNIDEMGNGGLTSNLSTGSFYAVEPIDEMQCYLYIYTMGNGYACYRLCAVDQTTVTGDVTGDGMVDVADINAVINVMTGKEEIDKWEGRSDVNSDGATDVADINTIINKILN